MYILWYKNNVIIIAIILKFILFYFDNNIFWFTFIIYTVYDVYNVQFCWIKLFTLFEYVCKKEIKCIKHWGPSINLKLT